MSRLPQIPEDRDPLASSHACQETLNLLALRRSTVAKDMTGPGPDETELGDLLRLAARVPDHGKLGPWRFIVFEGEARARFGDELGRIFTADEPGADEERIQFERDRLMRAPTVVCVTSKVTPDHKVPVWEQQLSAGAACQNLLIGARAMGFAAQWLTEWYAFHDAVNEVLKLGEHERVAGFVYIGTARCEPTERRRPDWRDRVKRF